MKFVKINNFDLLLMENKIINLLFLKIKEKREDNKRKSIETISMNYQNKTKSKNGLNSESFKTSEKKIKKKK